MKRTILWMFFLAAAPLVSASSLGGFQATCGAGGCSGVWNSGAFTFGGPFPGYGQLIPQNGGVTGVFPGPPGGCGPGTNGCGFTYLGSLCDYGVILNGGNCDAEIDLNGTVGVPPATGLPAGAVVNVQTTGTAEGFFCSPCTGPAYSTPPIFNQQVLVTYQFTLTDPSTGTFSWTGAQFSSVPEPASWGFAILGLAGAAFSRRRQRSRS